MVLEQLEILIPPLIGLFYSGFAGWSPCTYHCIVWWHYCGLGTNSNPNSTYYQCLFSFSSYLTMVISAGLTSYCLGIPLTVRFSFYPILGEYRWGWIGEFIDAWSIVTTLAKQKMETLQILRGWVGGKFFYMAWWVQISSTGYCLWIAFTNHVLLTRHHYSFHDFQVGAVVVLCWLVCQLKVTNYSPNYYFNHKSLTTFNFV